MINIIDESLESGRGLVTREGNKVRLYRSDAPGAYKIHGTEIRAGVEILRSWTLEGKCSSGLSSYNLTLYTVENHFPWAYLPEWAKRFVFLMEGRYYCASMRPSFKATPSETKITLPHDAVYYELPEVITKEIALQLPKERIEVWENPGFTT